MAVLGSGVRLAHFSLGFQFTVPSPAVSLVKEPKAVLIACKRRVRDFIPPGGRHKSVQRQNPPK